MNNLAKIFEGNWDEIKGKAKKQWGKLTDNDWKQINGSYDEFIGRVKKAYGYEADKVEAEIRDFMSDNNITMNDFKQSLVEVKDRVKDKAADIRDVVLDTLDEYFQDVKEKSINAEEAIVDYVKTNPLKTVGILAIAGLAVSAILKTRK